MRKIPAKLMDETHALAGFLDGIGETFIASGLRHAVYEYEQGAEATTLADVRQCVRACRKFVQAMQAMNRMSIPELKVLRRNLEEFAKGLAVGVYLDAIDGGYSVNREVSNAEEVISMINRILGDA